MNLFPSPSEKILQIIGQLSSLTKIPIQNSWKLPQFNDELAPLNDNGYITWEKGRKVQYLLQKIIIPRDLNGYPLEGLSLRMGLTWWAENAKVYIDDKLVQEGDLFDSSARILLTNFAYYHQEIIINIRLVSPQHDIGGLMKSYLVYESSDAGIDPQFVADELTILHNYIKAFEPEKLEDLAYSLSLINWEQVNNKQSFNQSLENLRMTLEPYRDKIKQRNLYLLGHAHLDIAWLWPIQETWSVVEKTFSSVLNLQKNFPELIFCHSSPLVYEWIEKNRPDIFLQIKEAITSQSWEILGGMWVEPEVNLISGESLVRQLLYGQKYIAEKFGKITQIAWLPDSFGFPWQLPQILKQSGINYFVTGKLHWNDTTKFPHGVFWWQSPDQSQVLALMSPPNVAGVMDTNPITMTNYAISWEQQTGLTDIFWLPGVGDHGGGPTRDMLEVQQRWQNSPFFPKIQFSTALHYLETISSPDFPVWKDELYLQFHRGCYTTHGDQKYFNRYSENLLYQAELWASLASISLGIDYPEKPLEMAWKKVLLNQFHDILPGTSIPEVFAEANQDWQGAITTGEKVLKSSLKAIAESISWDSLSVDNAQALVIFNSLNWERSQIVELEIKDKDIKVYDQERGQLRTQISKDNNLIFFAEDIPSVGYKVFWLKRVARDCQKEVKVNILENEQVKVIVNEQTGDLESIFDKVHQREVLAGAGNQIQTFQDQGQYWDAWNIDPHYAQYPLEETQLKSLEYLETGPLRWCLRVVRQWRDSQFCQDYILEIDSPILKIVNRVDWRETHVLVKVAFPLTVANDFATYEIACGAINRSHQEQEKWEVYGKNWADLSDKSGNYGVSLLNNCKYGYDAQSNQLRLTLLRGATWPDEKADLGSHQFTYTLYPHSQTWQAAKTVQKGYELNIPLEIVILERHKPSSSCLPLKASWISLGSQDLILMALKRSQEHPQEWILRCYESQGQGTELELTSDLGLELGQSVDLLERPTTERQDIEPWKIRSFNLRGRQKDHLTQPPEDRTPYR